MTKIIKKMLMICFLSFLIFTTFSCKKNNNESSDEFVPKLDKNINGSIVVAGSYNNFEALEAIFDDFSVYYPNLNMSYRKIDDYNNNISLSLLSDTAPDIYVMYPWMEGRSEYQNIFDCALDLSDKSLGLKLSDIREELLNQYDNKVLMLPVFSTTYGMLVNEDLFKEHNVKIPTTYEGLKTAVQVFKNANLSTMVGYKGAKFMSRYLFLPHFIKTLKDNKNLVDDINNYREEAKEYLRPTLEIVQKFIDDELIDFTTSYALEDDYDKMILRFFEGDIPMLICTGDTVSGTEKRKSKSASFTNKPFKYSFNPIPIEDEGGIYYEIPSIEFAVNKNSKNLDISKEFMRYLANKNVLNKMAQIKGLLTSSIDLSFDKVYAPFMNVSKERRVESQIIGLTDAAETQIREMIYKVFTKELSIDEAIAKFGKY